MSLPAAALKPEGYRPCNLGKRSCEAFALSAMSDRHARALYIVKSDSDNKVAYRPLSIDRDVDNSREFDELTQLIEYIVNLKKDFLTAHRARRVSAPPAGRAAQSGLSAPIIKPIFGKSGMKAGPQELQQLKQLSDAMYGEGADGQIPAGYTYLGQFIAHELCRSVFLNAPNEAENSGTFALDLGSIYDNAPIDGLKLKIGATDRHDAPFDIARSPAGEPQIGNDRNDSNLALAQMHAAIIRYHNAIAASGTFGNFDDVRRQVILSFQSVALNDWLVKLTSKALLDKIRAGSRFTVKGQTTLCPAEAVLAGFRCGHSMIRGHYPNWNAMQDSAASVGGLLKNTHGGGGLSDGKLPWGWPVNWRAFFPFPDNPASQAVMMARKIDTVVEERLATIDPRLLQVETGEVSLAYRTLWFGAAGELKDGWSIQQELAATVGAGEFQMVPNDLMPTNPGVAGLFAQGQPFAQHPPLWWFILREAERYNSSGGLAGVGARIVAETLVSAIEVSTPSILAGGAIHNSLPGGGTIEPKIINLLNWGNQPLDWYSAGYNF